MNSTQMNPLFWISAVGAMALALALVPMVRQIAIWAGFVDRPDLQRKLQTRPIALGGGVAVLLATLLAFLATIWVDSVGFAGSLPTDSSDWKLLFVAAAAILAIGLADDAIGLRGRQKLGLQCVVISVLLGTGTYIESIDLFGHGFSLGILSFPVTMLWLVVCINAVNLIDGADGMCGTTVALIGLGLGVLCLLTGNLTSAVVCFAMFGSLVGYLVFNRPPASIYLGDAGSMMLGLMVGVLAIGCHRAGGANELSSTALAVLVLPLLDSSAAIARRWFTGRSLYETDRGHLHHLLQRKYGAEGMLAVVVSLAAIAILSAVASIWVAQPLLALVGVVLVIGLLMISRSFGHGEARLIATRLVQFLHSFVLHESNCDATRMQRQVPLQGSGPWNTVWEPMVDFAQKNDFCRVKIDLNLAWLHEGYHANWQRARLPDRAEQLTINIPLVIERQPGSGQLVSIGRVIAIVSGRSSESRQRLVDFVDHCDEMRNELRKIVSSLDPQTATATGSPTEVPQPKPKLLELV